MKIISSRSAGPDDPIYAEGAVLFSRAATAQTPTSAEEHSGDLIKSRAAQLLNWAVMEEKPKGGRIQDREFGSSVLPSLLPLLEQTPAAIIKWLQQNNAEFVVRVVLESLKAEVDLAALEDKVRHKRYTGAFPGPMIMLVTDSHILQVSRAFIEAAEHAGIIVEHPQIAPKLNPKGSMIPARGKAIGQTPRVKRQRKMTSSAKHTDIFSGASVQDKYHGQVESYATKHAKEIRPSFFGNMVSSRQGTIWILAEGHMTKSPGRWGSRPSLTVDSELLRARILLHFNVDISQSDIYARYVHSLNEVSP